MGEDVTSSFFLIIGKMDGSGPFRLEAVKAIFDKFLTMEFILLFKKYKKYICRSIIFTPSDI
jgi:hypothetical protein